MQHAPQPVTTLTRAVNLLREYCQSPQFDHLYEIRDDQYFAWTIGDCLAHLNALFETEAFSWNSQGRARTFTRCIRELHEDPENVEPRYETEFDDVDGTRYDIMQVVGFIEQALGRYPFTYWNGRRQVSFNPLRTPSPESMAHSNGRRTPQPHDMRTDALLLMRSVLKKRE